MTEFTKLKVTFSLALLAVLFALNPLLKAIGSAGYQFLGVQIQVRLAYYSFAGLLGLTVYLYGIELLTERPLSTVRKVANITYALAILIVPFYGVAFLVSELIELVGVLVASRKILYISELILSSLSGIAAGFAVRFIARVFGRRDKSSALSQLSDEETTRLARARSLFKNEQYDLTVVECFKTLELSVRKALISASVSFRPTIMDMLSKAEKHNIIPEQIRAHIHEIRVLRNKAAHAEESISADTAKHVLDLTNRLLPVIEGEEAYATATTGAIQVETWVGTPEQAVYGVIRPGVHSHFIRLDNSGEQPYVIKLYASIEGDGIIYREGGTQWTMNPRQIHPRLDDLVFKDILVMKSHQPRTAKFQVKIEVSDGVDRNVITLTFEV